MLGVARGKLRGHGIGRNAALLGQPGAQGRAVQRAGGQSGMGVPARQDQGRIAAQCGTQPLPLQILLAKADIDQRDAPALPFHQRIGGKRGRQRGKPDPVRSDTAGRQNILHRAADPDGQIMAGSQGLGTGNHLGLIPDQHGIGVGSARIHAQRYRHASVSG